MHARVEFRTQDDEADASTSQEAQELIAAAQTIFKLTGAPPLLRHGRLLPRDGALYDINFNHTYEQARMACRAVTSPFSMCCM